MILGDEGDNCGTHIATIAVACLSSSGTWGEITREHWEVTREPRRRVLVVLQAHSGYD